jgi:hypothetical protein
MREPSIFPSQWPARSFRLQDQQLLNFKGGFFFFFKYDIQHCPICRPSDSTVWKDAGIEPRTVATTALAVRRSNHSARSHPPTRLDLIHIRRDLIHSRLDLIHSWLDLIHSWLDLIHSWLDLIHSRLDLIHTRLDLIHSGC